MRHIAVLLCLAATPAVADPCAEHFRAAMLAAMPVDRWLTDSEELLYSGLGWVTRDAVWERLENRRPNTTACQELRIIASELDLVHRRLSEAERGFRLATAFCWGVNRERAQRNLDALTDSSTMATDIEGYLGTLQERCN